MNPIRLNVSDNDLWNFIRAVAMRLDIPVERHSDKELWDYQKDLEMKTAISNGKMMEDAQYRDRMNALADKVEKAKIWNDEAALRAECDAQNREMVRKALFADMQNDKPRGPRYD